MEDVDRATRLFGTSRWRVIHELRRTDAIDGKEAVEEYVNLIRWRVERDLGYRWTHPLEVKNSKGRMYHMILATDNAAGTRIMTNLYGKAAAKYEEMRGEAIARRHGLYQMRMVLPDDATYEYEPPHDPPA